MLRGIARPERGQQVKRDVSGRESRQGFTFVSSLGVVSSSSGTFNEKHTKLGTGTDSAPCTLHLRDRSPLDSVLLVADGACRMPDAMGWGELHSLHSFVACKDRRRPMHVESNLESWTLDGDKMPSPPPPYASQDRLESAPTRFAEG